MNWNQSTRIFQRLIVILAAFFITTFTINKTHSTENSPFLSHRLPPHVLPQLGCWFWHEKEFEPNGYQEFLDLTHVHSSYRLLTTSIRAPLKEVTDRDVHDRIKEAAFYAKDREMQIVMDLDVRLARRAFQRLYPDEQQSLLIMQETDLTVEKPVQVKIPSRDISDHYTFQTTHYIPLQGTLLRVYSYQRQSEGILPETLQEITENCRIIRESTEVVEVEIPASPSNRERKACVMVSYQLLTPDVFAPHLLEFQRQILQGYADIPLAGACKDEWGFPPCFDGNPAKNEYWYSTYRAEEYAKRTNGRDLLFDCLLMHQRIQGQDRERLAAINHLMEMSWQRNGAIETDFYQAVKDTFGEQAIVSTHPTWWPYPDKREFMKNGLDWWVAKRDWAQTDEITPFAVRTALSKKWESPIWYNMYYFNRKSNYEKGVWSHALAGGRINYHPVWPPSGSQVNSSQELLQGDLMTAESRVRLLNYITRSPLDCPVAVLFGHACAMNWAGPAYDDVGMKLANAFWEAGFPADLIPSSEIENNQIRIDEDGWIRYGSQRYAAVVLYHPEFSRSEVASFFQKAEQGHSLLCQMGEWTKDFEGKPLSDEIHLPPSMNVYNDIDSLVTTVCQTLKEKQVEPHSPALSTLEGLGFPDSSSPSTEGFCRLIDGTVIWIAGTHQVTGDPIQKTVSIQKHPITFDAVGVAAVRLDREGKLEALAAGSLQEFTLDEFHIALPQPIDLALWKDPQGIFHGVVQNFQGEIPESLLKITQNWERIAIPVPAP